MIGKNVIIFYANVIILFHQIYVEGAPIIIMFEDHDIMIFRSNRSHFYLHGEKKIWGIIAMKIKFFRSFHAVK